MYERFKRAVLRFLKVPPEPHAPVGSPGSVRVFRAGENYYKYKLVLWGLRQMSAVVGAIMAIVLIGSVIDRGLVESKREFAENAAKAPAASSKRARLERSAWWVGKGRLAFDVIEIGGLVLLVVQIPFTFAMVRLDYEMRWYLTTDRSLRIREGLATVREMTLTFANVQNVSIRQGPLQRLLGLADVVVETAGGAGAGGKQGHEHGPSLHEGRLRGVDDAPGVRDLILARLKKLKDAGLGDPEDRQLHVDSEGHEPVPAPHAAAAALELLAEVRALRSALTARV
jgi:hypothetical protein